MPPAYDRPFGSEGDVFRGTFTWTPEFTTFHGEFQYVFHGCHEADLKTILQNNQVGLVSKWHFHPNEGADVERDGVWCTFNFYGNSDYGNFFGPFVLEFPLSVLNGRTFAVWRRDEDGKRRYVFLQQNPQLPLVLPAAPEPAPTPEEIWKEGDAHYNVIRDLVLTSTIPLESVSIRSEKHLRCALKKCNPTRASEASARRTLRGIAAKEITDFLLQSPAYAAIIRRYPSIQSESITLPDLPE